MKKLLFFVVTLLITSCCTVDPETNTSDNWLNPPENSENPDNEWNDLKKGDIVYFKLDSTRCIVNYVRSSGMFDIYYRNALGELFEMISEPKELYFR